ncbi:MAG: aldo/keto reductase [Hyphomicrobiaceae bacterium]
MLASTINVTATEAAATGVLTRAIPSSGERMPIVGLGSWITFNVGDDAELLSRSSDVIRAFLDAGGRMIDCSPMYGSSQSTIGHALKQLGGPKSVFSAEKVWTSSNGPAQIEKTRSFWGVPSFDLIQVHNLVAWEAHLPLLAEMKAEGRLRYIGLTTSHGLRHRQLERILSKEPIDFVQLTYNAVDRDAERRLLPLARERGIAVIVNRPFRQGRLVHRAERHPLPEWAAKVGARSWAQLLLKFVISHPAVTCAIPATTRVDHVRENIGCAEGVMPDAEARKRIADHVARL